MRIAWLTAGFTSLGLGVLGIALPLLPTTPLVLLSAFCFAQSSPHFHDWLLEHRYFGPMIHDWRHNRAISLRAKLVATLFLALAIGASAVAGFGAAVIAVQGAAMAGVLAFIWTRNTA